MQFHGIHHVTAVSGKIRQNLQFYTRVLGLRLVKRSVNQDDVSAYHLFYADKVGSPGTDMTFFDWPQTGENVRGTDSISNTMFRVNGEEALHYWMKRFDEHEVRHHGLEKILNRAVLRFEDQEGQRLYLVDDHGAEYEGVYWEESGIPQQYAIRGFYAVTLSVRVRAELDPLLTRLLNFESGSQYAALENPADTVTVYSMDGGGPGKELHVVEQPLQPEADLGAGGTHHVAFRLADEQEQQKWLSVLQRSRVPNSGVVDRYYFKSIYFRISRGILFELATDGPGFGADESLESLGERLALPPFLEPHRKEIEAGLKPI